MTTIVPIKANIPAQSFSTELGERFLNFFARWNSRAAHWTIDIADENNVLLIAGIVLHVGGDLLAPYKLGIGGLFVAGTSSGTSTAEPTLSNIGIESFLVHFPEGEISSFPL